MKKNVIVPAVAVLLLVGGGAMLMTKGADAITVASAQKGSILTAEQVNVSFQQVGGKVVKVLVQEEQRVKKGDILMQLDQTDTDLEIAKLETDIAQVDAQIKQTKETIQVSYEKLATQEQQATIGIRKAQTSQKQVNDGPRDEDIRQQQLAVQSAKEQYDEIHRNYDRIKQLYTQGAVPKSELDSISTSLSLAQKSVQQAQEALAKMQTGATIEEKMQATLSTEQAKTALSQVEQARHDLNATEIGVEKLQKQKDSLLVQLKSLQVKKERLSLRAPQDGKIVKVVTKEGENVSPGAPVVTLETDEMYYDVYLDEKQVTNIKAGGSFTGHMVALDQDIAGQVRFITQAPQFANLRMSRERGQADLSTFMVRVYVKRSEQLLPGMTVEVNVDEITAR